MGRLTPLWRDPRIWLAVVFMTVVVYGMYLPISSSPANRTAVPGPEGSAEARSWAKSGAPEEDVREIVRAVYRRDAETLAFFSSPSVKARYESAEAFEKGVDDALQEAPQTRRRGSPEVLEAAPDALFGDVVPYRVAVRDAGGHVHRLGVWLVDGEGGEKFCWIQSYPKDDPGGKLVQDLVGTERTCLEEG